MSAETCAVCQQRDAIGYCGECRVMLCRTCGRACAACGKGLCPAHQQVTSGGRTLCAACMQERNRRRALAQQQRQQEQAAAAAPGEYRHQDIHISTSRPVPDEAPAAPAAGGGLSFQDLLGEMPELQRGPAADEAALVNPDTGREEVWDPEVDAKLASLLGETGNIRSEALTGSMRRATPVWVSGIFTGGTSLLLCLLVIGQTGFHTFQPLVSYSIMVLSIGTILWCLHGMFRKEDPPRERKLCGIGLVLGIVATLVAFAFRNPGPAGPY